ncbi:MAG: hypothetical protein LUQ65_14685 [Candidatus Helarchaeota archaeon]|nr:hypothetical protein [Candidatus Helarchaeota archaeon]
MGTPQNAGINLAKSLLLPSPNVDRLSFKMYSGRSLAAAAQGESVEPMLSVILQVNPQQIQHNKAKITNKVQTNAPGRFVIFDWGTDLLIMNISGSTGNLLPDVVTKREHPFISSFNEVTDAIGANSLQSPIRSVDDVMKNDIVGSIPYFELLEMSPKYQAFMKLNELYERFDADQDVLVMEIADKCYRGIFQDFMFTHLATNPWNWNYTITFVSLFDFMSTTQRGDSEFADRSDISKGVD